MLSWLVEALDEATQASTGGLPRLLREGAWWWQVQHDRHHRVREHVDRQRCNTLQQMSMLKLQGSLYLLSASCEAIVQAAEAQRC